MGSALDGRPRKGKDKGQGDDGGQHWRVLPVESADGVVRFEARSASDNGLARNVQKDATREPSRREDADEMRRRRKRWKLEDQRQQRGLFWGKERSWAGGKKRGLGILAAATSQPRPPPPAIAHHPLYE